MTRHQFIIFILLSGITRVLFHSCNVTTNEVFVKSDQMGILPGTTKSSSTSRSSVKVIDACRLVNKNSRTMLKLCQLLVNQHNISYVSS